MISLTFFLGRHKFWILDAWLQYRQFDSSKVSNEVVVPIVVKVMSKVNTFFNLSAGADVTSGIDVAIFMRLQETAFGSKKDFLLYLKGYLKSWVI